MKNIITLSALCAALIACNNNNANSSNANNGSTTSADTEMVAQNPNILKLIQDCSWADFNFQDKIKKITEYTYEVEIDDNNNVKQGNLAEGDPILVKEFSPNGLLTRMANYSKNGETVVSESFYEYNNKYQLIAVKKKDSDSQSSESYEYSPEGFPTVCISTYKDNYESSESKKTYSVTVTPEGKKVIEKDTAHPDPNAHTVKYYNTKDLLIKEAVYNGTSQKPQIEFVYTYNDKNQCEKMEQIGNKSKKPFATSTFFYDKYGNTTKVIYNVPEGSDEPAQYVENVIEYTYDAKGNVTQATISNPEDPSIRVYKIEYY